MTKPKYEVYDSTLDKWETCVKADLQPSGWLHYELRDDTNGMARPGTWREKVSRPTTTAA